MSRRVTLAALCCAALALGACAHRRPTVARELARDIQRLEREEHRGRAGGAELARLGSLRYLAGNDREGEQELLGRAREMAPSDPQVLWRLARTASRDRRFPELLDAGVALLASDPDGAHTELAWRLLVAGQAQVSGLPAVVDGWIDGDGPPASRNPCTRDLLLGLQQERLATRGDRTASSAMLAERGYLTRWQMAGPTGDDPARDHDRLPLLPREGGVEVETGVPVVPLHPTRPGGGVYDAWATLEVDQGGRWLLSATATASLRLDVDGVALIDRNRWDHFVGRQTHGTLTLEPGVHVVHLRLTIDGAYGGFAIRALPLALEDPGLPPRGDLDAPPGTAIPILRSMPPDPEIRLDLALAESLTGLPFQGRVDSAELAAALPDSAEAHRRAGQSRLSDTSLVDAAREPTGVRLLRRALELDPELAGVAVILARRFRAQDPDSARELLQAVSERRPDLVEARLELVRGFEELGWSIEAEDALEDALELAPDRLDLQLEAHGFRAARGELEAAAPLARQALDAMGRPMDPSRADLLEDGGLLQEAAADLADLAGYEPHDERLWRERVRLIRATGDLDGARRVLEEATRRFPASPWPHVRLAELTLVDDPDGAVDHLRSALALDPNHMELRKRLWRLTEDRAAWLSGDPQPVDYDPAEPEAAVVEAMARIDADPGDTEAHPAVLLLDRREIQIFTGGASVFRLHRAIRLQNRAAVDAYGEVTPGRMEVIAARTWRPDGTPVDADPPLEKDAYSLRDLTPGCTVEVQALSAAGADAAGEDGGYVGPAVALGAGEEYVIRGELIFLLPPGARYTLRGTAPDPERTELPDGGLRLRWLTENQPPLIPEPYAPSGEEYRPWVQLLVWTDLQETLAPARVHRRISTRPAPEVTRLAAALVGDLSPEDAAQTVVDHVRREIRPAATSAEAVAEAVDVIAGAAGSHETAVLAILEAAGVPVDLVAVRPTYLPPLGNAPRLGSDYPVSLLRVVGDQGDLWIDLSDPHLPVGWLSPWLRNAELQPVGDPLAPLPDRTPAPSGRLPGIDAALTLVVDEAGDARGTLVLGLFRQSDALMRDEIWSVPEADRLQSFEGWLTEALPGISVRSAVARNRVDPDRPLEITLGIEVPRLFHDRDGTLEADALLPDLLPPIDGQSPLLSSLVLGGERTTPLLVWPYRESLTVHLSGPGVEGRSLEGWEPLAVRLPLVEVTRSRSQTRRALVLERRTTFRAGRIPAADYPDARTLLAAMVASGRNPVRLVQE